MTNIVKANGFQTIQGALLGSGDDTLSLFLGEDQYDGDVQFTITVNGQQVGGVQTVTAIQANGVDQQFTLEGDWGSNPVVSIDLLNAAWDGNTGNGNQRVLYMDAVTYDGASVANPMQSQGWNGPVFYATAPAMRASDFIQSIGVDTHITYNNTSYANQSNYIPDLEYLGIDHVRDGTVSQSYLTTFEQDMAAGIKFDMGISPNELDIQTDIQYFDELQTADPGGIAAIEGLNEVNSSFEYGGLTGAAAGNLFQSQLYAAVHADPTLSGVAVYNFTQLSLSASDYSQFGNISDEADYGNAHMYNGSGGLSNDTTTYLPMFLTGTPNDPFVVTEMGYDTLNNTDDVSAKYILDGIFDLIKAGASMAYVYELLDEQPDPNDTDSQQHFGLFNYDGTPKESAIGLHNLTTILADNGSTASTFDSGSLSFQLGNLPSDGNSFLLAKSDGSFDLSVWAEPQLQASQGSQQEIAAPAIPVTIYLGQTAAAVEVFDPLVGTAPVASYIDADSITFDVVDHPMIIEIDPVGTPAAARADSVSDTLVPSAPCYCPGTMIRTDHGAIAVEHLAIGDRVMTFAGQAKPIRWIGRRSFSGRFLMGRRDLLPVLISAGALGEGRPERNLQVSPLHAMYLEGVLVPAHLLVNGTTITQLSRCDSVEYIHIELAEHDVIWAEGAASETYVDDGSRGMFHNARDYDALYPSSSRNNLQFCAPRVVDGYRLEAVRGHLPNNARLRAAQ